MFKPAPLHFFPGQHQQNSAVFITFGPSFGNFSKTTAKQNAWRGLFCNDLIKNNLSLKEIFKKQNWLTSPALGEGFCWRDIKLRQEQQLAIPLRTV